MHTVDYINTIATITPYPSASIKKAEFYKMSFVARFIWQLKAGEWNIMRRQAGILLNN